MPDQPRAANDIKENDVIEVPTGLVVGSMTTGERAGSDVFCVVDDDGAMLHVEADEYAVEDYGRLVFRRQGQVVKQIGAGYWGRVFREREMEL